MKASSLVLFSLLAVGVGIEAQAGEIYTPDQYLAPWHSSKTRAEVKAETLRAIAAHEITVGEVDLPVAVATRSGLSRAEVRKETREALAAREIQFGEAVQPVVFTAARSRSRDEIKAELLMAQMDRAKANGRDLYAN